MFSLNVFKYSRRVIFLALIINIAFIIIYVTPLLAADTPSLDAGRAVSATFDNVWKELLLSDGGKSTLFTVLCKALTSIAILAIG
jgi:hypothetical protein